MSNDDVVVRAECGAETTLSETMLSPLLKSALVVLETFWPNS
jgi:hypothetical protein